LNVNRYWLAERQSMRGNKLLCNNVAGRKISITQTLTHHGSQSALLAAKVPGGGATPGANNLSWYRRSRQRAQNQ
jgi:hypothetical protein